MAWHRVCALSEIEVGEPVGFTVAGEDVLLCRVGDRDVYALENCCSHDDAPLEDGFLEGRELVCARHGARFDVTTGAVLRMPAPTGIASFPVRIDERGVIEVEVSDE